MSAEDALEIRRANAEAALKVIEQRKTSVAFSDKGGKPFGPDNPDNVAKLDPRPAYDRWPRKTKIWDKEIPNKDGILSVGFRTSEKCGVEDNGKPCQLLLRVSRTVNFKMLWDEYHEGGSLIYDFNDVRYYVSCIKHGPSPAGPEFWTSPTEKK